MKLSKTLFGAGLIVGAVALTTMTVDAVAQSAADHFKGRTVKLYAGAGAGGVYGLSGHLIVLPSNAAEIRRTVAAIVATPQSVVDRYKKMAGLAKK